MRKTEIMSEMDTTVLYLEEMHENRLMLEVTPMELGTSSARVFLDDTGIKKLKKFLADLDKPDMDVHLNQRIELAHKKLIAKLNMPDDDFKRI
jgi:hypothetical protein